MRSWLAMCMIGCAGAPPGGAELSAVAGPAVGMDLRPDAAWADAPFPAVHRWTDAGARVDDWPDPDGIPYVQTLLELAADRDGFGTTSGVLFSLDRPAELVPVDVWAGDDAPAFLVALDGPDVGRRVPIDVTLEDDGGPFGTTQQIVMLPLQGVPLSPDTTWAGVLLRDLGVEPLGVPLELVQLAAGVDPEGWEPDVAATLRDALSQLDVPADEVAGLTVFRTGDPTADFLDVTAVARGEAVPALDGPPVLTEVYDTYCVFETTVGMPVFQGGEPPYETEGGGWVIGDDGRPVQQDVGPSRVWFTVPRRAAPLGGYPVVVMVRTGGGGDRPLIDRGVRGEPGGPALEPGTGPALTFASAGFVGVQVDGPHGGARNPTGGDEQFLMFNVANPLATRDNVRQSALELALLPAVLDGLQLDASGCDGATSSADLDLDTMALLGHSMGATIAPLTMAAAPEYDAMILSGAGGSYIHNLVHKRSPIEVRPVAEALLGFSRRDRELRVSDPVLQLLQWAAEPADPPVYGAAIDADVLMIQGIVDTYILPPMANAASLSLELDLAGIPLDADHPELSDFRPLEPLLPLVGAEAVPLPVEGPGVGVVVQQSEGPVEDGHEVLFQTDAPQHAMRCFLEGLSAGSARVPAPGLVADLCTD